MLNIKNAKSDELHKAFHSDKALQRKTPENLYKSPITIVFIDSAVDEYQSLVDSAIPEAEVIVLDSTGDGVEQITKALQGRTNVAAIHIVSHGSPGCLYLGNSQLSLDSLNHYAPQLKTWSTADSPTSTLLYGCNVAAGDAGAEFVERLHQLTSTNIAASAKRTGSAALKGDWNLEVTTSPMEVFLAFSEQVKENYTSVLATFTVTNTNDNGAGSLRNAIEQANTTLGADTITFTGSVFTDTEADTINLTSEELRISDDLTIEGLGADQLTISGNNDSRVFRVDDGDTNNFIDVELSGLTISDGKADGFGFDGIGGGIVNLEFLRVTDSVITNNQSAGFGAGINNNGGRVILTRSTVSENRIITFPASGGFFTAGGGISNSNNGFLVLDSSTISGNQANRGGGIFSNGFLTIANSTISGNQGAARGGGIFTAGTAIINSSTITGNEANIQRDTVRPEAAGGGGIYNLGTVSVANTIIASNIDAGFTTSDFSPDVFGDFSTTRFNLIGDGTGSNFVNSVNGNQVGTSANPIDPLLSPLQDNGGPTFTHALLDGSPAIDAANPFAGVRFDQREVSRPQGNGFDIGAFEAIFTPIVLPLIITPNDDTVTGTPGNDIVISGGGQDQIFGGSGDDVLDGGDGDDGMSGGEDNDTLLGGSGQDQLSGDNGNNSLDGGDGDDNLSGGEGNDTLLGGQGQDRLFGDSSDDLLNGGSGDNTLTGGFGSDIFVLSTEGKNTIVDFEDGQDLLKLDGGLTFGSLSIFEQNGDTWITTNNNQPLAFLTGVDSNLITATDFTV